MKDEKERKGLDKDGVIGDTGNNEDEVLFEEEEEEAAAGDAKTKLKKLRDELKTCHTEKGEYLAGWQRAKADLVNERRDEEARHADLVRFGQEKLLIDIISVLDSFEQAIGNKEAWEKVDQNWRKGVEYIYSQLLTVLTHYGGRPFDPSGESFDPSLHDSLETVPVAAPEKDHMIVEVLQKGYLLNDKVLRPAKVKVGTFQ